MDPYQIRKQKRREKVSKLERASNAVIVAYQKFIEAMEAMENSEAYEATLTKTLQETRSYPFKEDLIDSLSNVDEFFGEIIGSCSIYIREGYQGSDEAVAVKED